MNAPTQPIDPVNEFLVGSRGDDIVVMLPPSAMTRHQALSYAAWLVTIADRDDEFPAYLKAVRNT